MYTTVSYDNLDTYLAGLAANTQDTPYEIDISNVTVSFLYGYAVSRQGTLQYVLQNNATKYVSLKFEAPAELTSIGYMCYGCTSLVEITVTGMENVTVAWNAFFGCTSLVAADVSCMESLRRAHDMFRECSSLTSVDISSSGGLTETVRMFLYCGLLVSVTLPAMADVTDASSMFYGCTSLASVDVSGMTSVTNADGMFAHCTSLASVDVSSMTSVTNASSMFYSCTSLVSVNASGMVSVSNALDIFLGCESLTSVDISGMASVTNAYGMFYRCRRLVEIHGWSIPSTAVMTNCFDGCSALEAIYVPEPSPSESSWHAWDIKKDTANSLSEVTIYGTSGNPVTVQVPSSGSYTLEASAKVDELLFSGTSAITQTHINKMLATQTPITGNTNALDPTQDNFVMLAKDRNAIKTNITTDVIEAGNKLPPTSEAVQAAIGGAIIPTGTILEYGGSVAPIGFVLCFGQTALRYDYANLIAWAIVNDAIGPGKLIGEGDGSTTFTFPDLRECVIVGAGENTTYVTGNSDGVIAAHDVYNVGEFKDDQFQGHEHGWDRDCWNGRNQVRSGSNDGGNPGQSIRIMTKSGYGTPRYGTTTHGKQIGMNRIIKI